MRTLVIGAHGKIGQRLVRKLVQADIPVRAMIRSEEQRPALETMGAEVVTGDLENGFETALADCDAMVFTAGSGGHTGPDKTFLVDLWGAVKTMRACERLGIRRYIMISARNAGDPDSGPDSRKPYLIAKHLVDEELMRSPLDYTILRPGRLIEDPGTGRIRTTRPDKDEQFITRDDVAAAILFCLQHDATIGKTIQLYQGGTPVENALLD